MRFLALAETLEKIEHTSSTLSIRDILARFFRQVPSKEIGIVCNLIEGQLASPYEGIVLGVAEKTALKAIARSAGKDLAAVERTHKRLGDAGLTAQEYSARASSTLSIPAVYETLLHVARESGTGSQEIKNTRIAGLLSKCAPIEARYIARIAVGQLRLGAGTMTVLDSLAIAYLGGKQHRAELEQAYNICPDIALIAQTAATTGLAGIRKIDVKIGRPIKMMLASRVDSIQSIKERMDEICAEEKYDGERIQAHFDGKKIVLFSRRMDDVTDQFPDVIAGLRAATRAKRYIIEGECCAVDPDGNLEPFQRLMKRRRKHGIKEYSKNIPVTLFLFDLLHLNGTTYLHKPLPARRKALESIFRRVPGKGASARQPIALARKIITRDIDDVEDFFNQSLERGCEGIIAKDHADKGSYQAGTRGWQWIKWKREYSKDLQDTFDLAVVGATMGKGKRSGSFGTLLCAAYNKAKDRFETVCKIGSGFTDNELRSIPKTLAPYKSPKRPLNVIAKPAEEPDAWFRPGKVLEALAAEITRSPTHTCAEKDGKGLALRFPRFVRWRDDKDAAQATTTVEIEHMAKRTSRPRNR